MGYYGFYNHTSIAIILELIIDLVIKKRPGYLKDENELRNL